MNSATNENIISVRGATNDDLTLLNHIYYHSKAYWGYDKKFLDNFMSVYKLDEAYLANNVVKIFSLNNHPIGYYGFFLEEDGSIELDHLFLLPDYIGKGFGRPLWQACCETAKGLGKTEFILWSELGAESFYAKMGCEKIGMKASDLLPEQPSAIMRYKLS